MLIPNVFEVIANLILIKWSLPQWVYEILIRVILFIVDSLALSRTFYFISFISVGNSYESGSEPWWGSVCYTIYYAVYMAIPILLIRFFLWWVIAIVFSAYLLICIGIYLISLKLDTLPDNWIARAILHSFCFAVIVTITSLLYHYL